jgi:hypothetical protein
MRETFRYRIESENGVVVASIHQFFAKRCLLSLTWSVFWGWAAFALERAKLGFGGFLGMLFSILLAALGLLIANYTLLDSKLIITATTLKARMRTLFTQKTKSFPMESVRGLGFGNYGHSARPVLKFQSAHTWYVLATDVEKDETLKFVQAIEARGVVVH